MKKDNVYIPEEVRVSIFFEKDHICCAYCPFYETYSRKQCRLTGEYLLSEYGRGYYCRLELQEVFSDDSREIDENSIGAESTEIKA